MEFRILDLFCGAGGFSYGMHMNSDFHTKVALDVDIEAANTFKKNMPETHVVVGDITNDWVKNEVIKVAKQANVNMIIGGPPCQGFSLKGKKLGLEDSRNFLFLEYLRIVEEIKPEVFVIENVKALLSTAGGYFRDEILKYIAALGYTVKYGVLNAKNFGIPQSRERAIFICSKSKVIQLPIGSECIVSIRDAISDLSYLNSAEGEFESNYRLPAQSAYQEMLRNKGGVLFNHQATAHSKTSLEKLSMIPPEKGKECLPEEMIGKQKFNTTWGRLTWDGISPTIDTRFDAPSNGTNSHPVLNRSITPREAARIQSFRDEFVFFGGKRSIGRQIGNAVPPLLAKAIADSIGEMYRYE